MAISIYLWRGQWKYHAREPFCICKSNPGHTSGIPSLITSNSTLQSLIYMRWCKEQTINLINRSIIIIYVYKFLQLISHFSCQSVLFIHFVYNLLELQVIEGLMVAWLICSNELSGWIKNLLLLFILCFSNWHVCCVVCWFVLPSTL